MSLQVVRNGDSVPDGAPEKPRKQAAIGFEPMNRGFAIRSHQTLTTCDGKHLENADNGSAAKCAAIPADLGVIVAAWPELSASIRATLLALVEARAAEGASE